MSVIMKGPATSHGGGERLLQLLKKGVGWSLNAGPSTVG